MGSWAFLRWKVAFHKLSPGPKPFTAPETGADCGASGSSDFLHSALQFPISTSWGWTQG